MKRYRFIYFLVACFVFAVVCRLINLQVINGKAYLEESRMHLVKTSTIKAPRGEILDRSGKAMVTNETVFAIRLYKIADMEEEALNQLLFRLIQEVEADGVAITDSLPIVKGAYTIEGEKLEKWLKSYGIGENADAETALLFFKDRYGINNNLSGEELRKQIGIRYEMEQTGFSARTPYTVAEGISNTLMTKLKEQKLDFPGVVIETSPMRRFTSGTACAHVLGRVDKLYKEEYEQLKDKNYSMNDVIGKQGIERYLEDDLRGTDGLNRVEQSIDGQSVTTVEEKPAKKGNNAVLTLDLKLQQSAEKALADALQYVREQSVYENGEGANATNGALCAVDVNSGEILALVSYPSYNPATFNADYESLRTDSRAPMFNRAIGGAYEPGSTFKMATAISALEEGVITPTDTIVDEGIYKFYDDYQPACWIYRGTGQTHGAVNVSEALKHSCNYFFYDIGRRTTIEKMNFYAKELGLGTATGIELSEEENLGKLAGPAQSEKDGETWMPGDTLQYAIGQSKNLFTPLQLANYLATIVNGGTRYRTHLVKAVRDSETGALLREEKPTVLSRLNIKEENRRAIMEGMRDVVELGTASTVFKDFNVAVGGKTGTAEVPGKADNAIFVGFAPYDNPQIAVCVVLEEGVHGANAGRAVRDVLDTYFNSEVEAAEVEKTNVLLP
ncbi:MAG: penicillin-binding transpeptidase domain-containing protein [Clostridia bacterium]|nr:penicillin-binding transpeptidase domain-containing protein [Clostridia bacterium]